LRALHSSRNGSRHWMDGYLKDQSIKGKTSCVEVLALKRSNEGWAVESLHYLWQGAAETQRASRSRLHQGILHQRKNHSWCKSGTRDAANDMPGAKQQYLAESITRMGQFDCTRCKRWAQATGGRVVAPSTRRRGRRVTRRWQGVRCTGSVRLRLQRLSCPGGTEESLKNTDFTDVNQEPEEQMAGRKMEL